MAYKFNEKTPTQTIYELQEGVYVPVQKKGIYPFGAQNKFITDADLNEDMVKYLTKEGSEYRELITEVKK